MAFSWSNVWDKVKDTAYQITPADNIMNIAREFGKPGGPNWSTIGKNLAGGAFDVAAFALPAAGAVRGARVAGTALGARSLLPALAKGAAGNLAFGTAVNMLPGGQPATAAQTGVSPAPQTSQGRNAESDRWLTQGGYRYQNTPARVINNELQVFDRAKNRWQPAEWTDPSTGFKYSYNDVTKMYEVVGNTKPTAPAARAAGAGGAGGAAATPPKELMALQAALQQQFDAARISAQSEADRALNELMRAGTQSSIAAQSDLRRAGMAGRGQQIDLGSYLAEAGVGASPAMGDVAQQYIQEQEAAARSGILTRRAGEIAQIAEQEQATRDALRAALDRLRQQETTARAQVSLAALQNLYGGV